MNRLRLRRLAVVLALLAISVPDAMAAPRRTPIILDTDIGGDIDDAFALALILDSPELDLRAVTTVSGDTQARARLAAKMLAAAGRTGVPVAAGLPGPPSDAPQTRWAAGFTSRELVSRGAADLMREEIDRARGQMVVVAIGPLTNVAALLRQYPAEGHKIREIVLMGGSIRRGYYPNSGPTAEYNIAADAAASQIVFASGVPLLMAPLDVTARLQLQGPNLDRIFASHTPLTDALQSLYKLWGQPVPTLHDPMAVSLLLDPALCTRKPLAIRISEKGMTEAETGKPSNAVVAVETDPARFIAFYMSRVARSMRAHTSIQR
ncbi:MAG TPA: nucleoside hydrolase [Acidobacteriaceae bacterium]|jgi:inosine-uridine nucleoside N-ribohydrolase|nr:nucleoside hydrolase [Acidobacteriaceae bacterium]